MIVGVDPGIHGALAAYWPTTGDLNIVHMPVRLAFKKGRTKETRVHTIDIRALFDYFEIAKLCGCELVVVENVGQRPKQANMFQFGWSAAMVHAAAIHAKLPIERVHPAKWKADMKVPGKKALVNSVLANVELVDKSLSKAVDKANEDAILARTDIEFPNHGHLFRTTTGRARLDFCEAALLAKFCARFMLRLSEGRVSREDYEAFYTRRDAE